MSISKYFTKSKRPYTSASSESDTDTSFRERQEKKRQHTDREVFEEEEIEMSVKETLAKINDRLELLATKKDIEELKGDMESLTNVFMEKIEKIEGRLFEVEARWDEMDNEIKKLKKENEDLKDVLKSQEIHIRKTQIEQNDLQQYSRRWNLRLFRVPEQSGESVEDCIKKCCEIFTEKVQVKTEPSDIEIAHRTGQSSGSQGARPILVRFFDRKKRDQVITNRRNLKNKGIVIGEDLTFATYKIYQAASKHSACANAWTKNGKVFAKLKNGHLLKPDIHTNVDQAIQRIMAGRN